MAELGKRVMLIDADLRRSAIDTDFGVKYSKNAPKGLTHYLSGSMQHRGNPISDQY